MTEFFTQLATHRPQLNVSVVAVLIVDEEAGSSPIGVEELMRTGELDFLKNGLVLWLDWYFTYESLIDILLYSLFLAFCFR